jgi:H+-transporting ATPase
MPFDPTVKRTEGTIQNPDGSIFKTTKGAPHVILALCNDPAVHHRCEEDVTKLGERGIRSLAVAKKDGEGEWKMLGLLTFLDPPRPDTKKTIEDANKYGVEVKMITGDHLLIAKETARQLGMNTNIKDTKVPTDRPTDLRTHEIYL